MPFRFQTARQTQRPAMVREFDEYWTATPLFSPLPCSRPAFTWKTKGKLSNHKNNIGNIGRDSTFSKSTVELVVGNFLMELHTVPVG